MTDDRQDNIIYGSKLTLVVYSRHLGMLGTAPLLPQDRPPEQTEAEYRAREVCQV